MQILVIEDDPLSSRLIKEYLSSSLGSPNLTLARSCREAEAALKEDLFDVILLDLNLPDSVGMQTFSRLQRFAEDAPVIVLSGTDNREIAVEAVRNGAQDYLVKSHFDSHLLERAISYAIERKRSEEQIKRSLKEKEALIREIHHRVKNNLQIICSLLSLQARLGNSEIIKTAFSEMRARIISMSLIHEELYQSDSFAYLDCTHYTERLVSSVLGSLTKESVAIEHQLTLEAVLLSMDRAVPYGLLLNELVSNALTHGVNGRERAAMWLSLSNLEDGRVELLVEDDGPGLPENVSLNQKDSLGLLLIKTLADQLGGEVSYRKSERCSFAVIFPREEQNSEISAGTPSNDR